MATIHTRTSRDTKTKVTYGLAHDLDVDVADGKWAAICEAHSTIVNTDTQRMASRMSPLDFCDYCNRLQGANFGAYMNEWLDWDLERMRREAPPVS